MTRRSGAVWLVVLVGGAWLTACGSGGKTGPWLTMPSAASHSALHFPINAGDVHGPTTLGGAPACDACHADATQATPTPAQSFKTFTCTGCHVEIRPGVFHDDITVLGNMVAHTGTTVFTASDRVGYDHACRSCHPQGIGVDHSTIFPLPHRNAGGTIVAGCGDCHVVPANRTQLGCAACHPHDQAPTVTAHAAVVGFDATGTTTASAQCARCHVDSTIPIKVAAHSAFPITAGATHLSVACLGCHTSSLPPKKAFAADFAQFTCTTCHVALSAASGAFHDDGAALATFHAGVANFQFTDAACRSCHPDGAGGAPAYHAQLFPIGGGTKHAGIACGDCHGTVRTSVDQLKCAACHADSSKSPNFPTVHSNAVATILAFLTTPPPPASCTAPAFTPTGAQCLQCHALSHVDLASSHPTGDSTFGNRTHRGAGCLTCHVSTTTVKPTGSTGYTAVDFTQPARPSQSSPGCATCHPSCAGNGG